MRYLMWFLCVFGLTLLTACGVPEEPVDGVSSGGGSGGGSSTTVPSQPTGLAAVAGDAQIALSWTATTGATSYNVYYGTATLATLTDLSQISSVAGGTLLADQTGTTATVTGLTNSTPYFFVITAKNSIGESVKSAEVTATPGSSSTAPAAPTGLAAKAGDAKVDLTWTAAAGASSYNLYYATESFASLTSIANYASLAGGTLMKDLTSTAATVPPSTSGTPLVNGTPYFFVVTAQNSAGESAKSTEATAKPAAAVDLSKVKQLNDTGLTYSANFPDGVLKTGELHNVGCTGDIAAQQDCSHGLDATSSEGEDGFAGFSYTKLDSAGVALAASATDWHCVKDNVTGLVWEVKQGTDGVVGNSGLHDADDTFSWHNPELTENGRDEGAKDPLTLASCSGYSTLDANKCNTKAFVERVNLVGLCGKKDWRMPTPNELLGLVHFGKSDTFIESNYFPNVPNDARFFSSGTDTEKPDRAWIVLFSSGSLTVTGGSLVLTGSKGENRQVRLVREGE